MTLVWKCKGCLLGLLAWLVVGEQRGTAEKAGQRSSITCYLNNRLSDTCQNVALILLLARARACSGGQQTLQ